MGTSPQKHKSEFCSIAFLSSFHPVTDNISKCLFRRIVADRSLIHFRCVQ